MITGNTNALTVGNIEIEHFLDKNVRNVWRQLETNLCESGGYKIEIKCVSYLLN